MKAIKSSSVLDFIRLIFVVFIVSISSTHASAQGTIPTVGTDFWYGYMHNSASSNEELRLFVSSQVATTGTVDIPLQGWSTTFAVAPNVTTTIIIPNSVGESVSSDIVETKGIHVTTSDTVSLFAINFATFSADASKILPKTSLGTDYLIIGYDGLNGYNRSEFLVVATADNTQIEITPAVMTEGNHSAGIPFIVDLNAGETYQIRSQSTYDDLTGSKVVATPQSGECRPFAVFSGAQCANVPTNCTTCDHLYDQLLPVETWGTEYYVVPYQTTGVYTYRVMARDNGTQISIDGGAPTPMTAGQVLEFNNVSTPTQVVSNNPIQVVQYMQGDACSSNGDPAMLVLNANDQKIGNVTFSTVSSNVITNHFMNVIVETADIGTILLDNVPIPAANFTTFLSNPLNAYAQISLPQGSHNLYATNGFSAYIYGMGTAESYSYSVGSFKQEPQFVVDTTICTIDSVVLATPVTLFSPVWVAMSDTTVVIGTGNSLVMYPPIPTDIYSVTGNSLISGCPVTYNYSISAPTVPVINMTASEDTVCMFNSVQMNVDVISPGTYQYEWWPSFLYNNPNSSNPTLTVQQSGWYGVTVSNVGGLCSVATDSVYILVQGGGIESISVSSSSNALCLPDSALLSGVVNQIILNEDFEGGINTNIWDNTQGSTPSTVCGSVSGSALYFNGGFNRLAQTVAYDLSNGGTLNFYIKVATGSVPCDDAEIGEDVFLEYSTNGGVTWVPMATLIESNYPVFSFVSLPVPAGAQTTTTQFRWIQPNFTGPYQDIWLLDNISLSAINASGVNYTWEPAQFLSNPSNPNTTAIPSVPTWFVLEVGQGNCVYSDSVFIDVNPAFTLATTSDTSICSGQTIQISTTPSAGSGYSYFWDPVGVISSSNILDTITILSNVDTTFFVTVTSPLGCTQNDSVHVISTTMDFDILGDTLICLDETITLEAIVNSTNSVNYSFEWFENSVSIGNSNTIQVSPLITTEYISLITGQASQCEWYDTILVEVNNFIVDAGPDTTLCSTLGYIMQGITSASIPTILWNNGNYLGTTAALNPTVIADISEQFILSVNDGVCQYSDTMNLTFNPPSPVYIPMDTTICEGQSFSLDFSGITNIAWSSTTGITNPQGVQPIVSPTSTQTYYVDYASSNGCPVEDTMTVQVNLIPEVTLPADITMCIGVTQTLNSIVNTANGTYLWNTMESTSSIQIQNQGIYWVEYNTVCGSDIDSVLISFHPDFSIDLGNDSLMCSGYSLTLSPAIPVGGNIMWSTNSTAPSIVVTSPSLTSVIVYDAFGCARVDTVELTALPAIQIDLGADVSMCEYDSTLLDGSSPQGVSYSWNTGAITEMIYVADAGTYIVEITDALGCLNSDTIIIIETQTPAPSITGLIYFCSNETVQFEATTGFTAYEWSTGGQSNPMQFMGITDEIWVLVTDANNCIGGDTIQVDVVDVPVLDLGNDIVLCESQLVILNGEVPGASGYLWSPTGETSPSIDAFPGEYSLVVNYEICTITDQIFISVEPYTFDLGQDQIICMEQGIFLSHPMTNIDSIIWHDGTKASWYEQLNYSSLADTIEVSATAYGCDVKNDTVLIILEDCNCQVYVPNAFTPNGDQYNEGFAVYHDCPVVAFEFYIFNRWGELVFKTTDPSFVWNGETADGIPIQDGVYSWKMRYTNEFTRDTRYKEMHGHVNVLR